MTNGFPPAFARRYGSRLKRLRLKGLQPRLVDVRASAIRRPGGYFDYWIDALSREHSSPVPLSRISGDWQETVVCPLFAHASMIMISE